MTEEPRREKELDWFLLGISIVSPLIHRKSYLSSSWRNMVIGGDSSVNLGLISAKHMQKENISVVGG